MDHFIPPTPVLLQRRSAEATYLWPFKQLLRRLDRAKHGFAESEVAHVLGAWTGAGDAWEGGFLVDLVDGRRVEIRGLVDGFLWDDEVDVQVEFFRADMNYASSDLPTDHRVRVYGWADQLIELDSYLDKMAGEYVARMAIDRASWSQSFVRS